MFAWLVVFNILEWRVYLEFHGKFKHQYLSMVGPFKYFLIEKKWSWTVDMTLGLVCMGVNLRNAEEAGYTKIRMSQSEFLG